MRYLIIAFASLSAGGFADTVHLTSGKAIQGVVVEESASGLEVETAAGIMRFGRAEVSRIDRDNAQVLASLQKLVTSGQGSEALDRISRLDHSRFSAAELTAIDQLAGQVKQQSAVATAQVINQQDQKVNAEANAIYEKLGWRECAKHLEQACAASAHVLPTSQYALIELYAAHATYTEAVDFAPKADKMVAAATGQYRQTLEASRRKLDKKIAQLTEEKEKRDQAFASAGESRARLEQAAYQRAQVAAAKGALIAASNPQLFKPKTVDKSKIEAANKSRAAALTKAAMDKAGVKMNCQGGVCPSR